MRKHRYACLANTGRGGCSELQLASGGVGNCLQTNCRVQRARNEYGIRRIPNTKNTIPRSVADNCSDHNAIPNINSALHQLNLEGNRASNRSLGRHELKIVRGKRSRSISERTIDIQSVSRNTLEDTNALDCDTVRCAHNLSVAFAHIIDTCRLANRAKIALRCAPRKNAVDERL